jgi:Holliday junction resolvasome RuvABC endonuclease subunit
MRVLAFDASSTTGWAYFAHPRARPVLGDFELPSSAANYGKRSAAMQAHVVRLIDQFQPEIVTFEAPIFLPHDRWHTRRLLTSLVVVIELVAYAKGCRCIEVDPAVAKAALAGPKRRRGRGKKLRNANKDEMMVAAVNMGWPVANDHQADACGVALATFAYLQRESRFGQWEPVHG